MTTPDHYDILMTRIVDQEASAADWAAFSAAAESNPELWRLLAETQRQADLIAGVVTDATEVADDVTVPRFDTTPTTLTFRRAARRLLTGSGWAVAAALGLAWVLGGGPFGETVPPTPVGSAGTVTPISTASDHLAKYLELGRQSGAVVGEIPSKILIQSSPVGEGQGFEVIYIRQVLERTVVPEIFEMGDDTTETGAPTLVRFQPAATGGGL